MHTLIDSLQEEHATMRDLLTVMRYEISKGTPLDLDLLIDIFRYCNSYSDSHHHPKEDLLYNALCRHAPGAAVGLDDIETEHTLIASATLEILELLERAKKGEIKASEKAMHNIASYVRFYRSHMLREEEEFFPLARQVLTTASWNELDARLVNPTDPFLAEKAQTLLREMAEKAS